jgi:glc operon protein GlcG
MPPLVDWKHNLPEEFVNRLLAAILLPAMAAFANDLPSKKYLDLANIRIMVSAAEAKAKVLNVSVTICVVDESGNLLFLEKGETASLNTIQFAQRKARHAAFYGKPSKEGADTIKKGNAEALAFPEFFPNQGGLPIKVNGQLLGGISASGAKSEIDETIAQSGLDALLKQSRSD